MKPDRTLPSYPGLTLYASNHPPLERKLAMKLAPKKTTTEVLDPVETPASGATEPASVGSPDPIEPADTEDSAGMIPSRIATTTRKTALFTAAATLFAAALATGYTLGNRSADPSTASALVASEPQALAPAASAPELVALALDEAESYRAVNSTFVGFTMPGLVTASSSTVILVAASLDGVCAYSKIVDAVRFEVGTDATGETCMPATLESAQKMLDDLESSAGLSATAALGASITAAAEAAVLYASMSFDATGRPSLYGLTNLQVPGTKVLSVARDGQSARVQVETDGLCSIVKVAATANITPPNEPC